MDKITYKKLWKLFHSSQAMEVFSCPPHFNYSASSWAGCLAHLSMNPCCQGWKQWKRRKWCFSFSFLHLQQMKSQWGKKPVSNKKKFDQTPYSFLHHLSSLSLLPPQLSPNCLSADCEGTVNAEDWPHVWCGRHPTLTHSHPRWLFLPCNIHVWSQLS